MAMLRTDRISATRVEGWLADVQRDPRTVGAFRRRIEALLRDPGVARRVAGRLALRAAEGRSTPPEPADAPAWPAPVAGPALGCAVCGTPEIHPLLAPFLPRRRRRASIIGCCDRDGPCPLLGRAWPGDGRLVLPPVPLRP